MKRGFSFLAIGLLCAMGAFAQDFPAYLTMEGTTITGCYIDDIPDNLVIPEGVTEIDGGAFSECTSLKSVSIPDGVTKIGDYAFVGCESLKNVTIPASVKSIEEGAFESCEKLTVRYNGTLAQWCEMDNNTFLVPYAKEIALSDVANLKAKTALAIPEGPAKIGIFAFAGCKSLKRVSIPASVTEIGWSAFESCYSLKSVAISDGVKEIGSEAFVECYSLKSVDIPASVTRIGYCAFESCKSLKSVTIPASVTEIGWNAFQDCTSLKKVKYLGTIAQWQTFNVRLNPGTVVRCSDGEAVTFDPADADGF